MFILYSFIDNNTGATYYFLEFKKAYDSGQEIEANYEKLKPEFDGADFWGVRGKNSYEIYKNFLRMEKEGEINIIERKKDLFPYKGGHYGKMEL